MTDSPARQRESVDAAREALLDFGVAAQLLIRAMAAYHDDWMNSEQVERLNRAKET
jgi:hypothetical protein